MTDVDSTTPGADGPAPEPDVPDQTDGSSLDDPEPDVAEDDVDVSDIEEGEVLESVSRLQRPKVSVARARRHTSGFSGQCLLFVSKCLDGQHKYGLRNANAAFHASRDLRTTGTPPAGVPVYFLGSKHGHVALSVGGGRIRSTDWPSQGQIAEVAITVLAKTWGRKYSGWATDIAGHRIPGLSLSSGEPSAAAAATRGPRPYPGTSTTRGARGATVSVVQDRLSDLGADIDVDGRFGPATEAAVRSFQKKRGLEVDGRVGPRTWAALFG